jgi:hypothetical protein
MKCPICGCKKTAKQIWIELEPLQKIPLSEKSAAQAATTIALEWVMGIRDEIYTR